MDESTRISYQGKAESLLFAYGAAMPVSSVASALGVTSEEALEVLSALDQEYQAMPGRGLCLLRQGDVWQLGTKPENLGTIEAVAKQDFEQELSAASLETLSIILYRAPIARADIDAIRGVNSSFIIRNLLMRGLVEREHDAKGHHIFLYKPSLALLQTLGITGADQLPDFETLSRKFDALVEDAKLQEEQSAESIIASSVSE